MCVSIRLGASINASTYRTLLKVCVASKNGFATCWPAALSQIRGQAAVQEVIGLETITLPLTVCGMTVGPRAAVSQHSLHGVKLLLRDAVLALYICISGRGNERSILASIYVAPET